MILDVAASHSGEGWVHYMYPEPGDIFPTWKSTFVKRVTFPSGKQHVVGSRDLQHADGQGASSRMWSIVLLLSSPAEERNAFGQLRDKTGPFVFMDTYVFVETPDGIELVNPAQPSLEGKNLIDAEGR